ncbi:sigma-70 family RNA polymerase sigma factor [Actinomadura harenae]|uniref:RNA polymerase sigma factor n=1 Tax=Actinomadura harenae TaxID=2483351 RepID=A0A3M2LXF2_9ACTN|nr:sigma-70 family RNA polymerase sigma factor [Actinomadura harenae]RMI40725.1 sigma-70 family RNA polymerase sigma factor [Actinomadura harenae]
MSEDQSLVVDEAAFTDLAEKHRRELQVHCYRMLGSIEDSEDLVQETFLRAWKKRDTFQGRSTFRAWLYRIATNACLDFLSANPRRPVPRRIGETDRRNLPDEIPWLQPIPGHLIEPLTEVSAEPDAVVVAKETIELAFIAAIQYLPPKQRSVLLLRDVLGYPAKDASDILGTSVISVNSALQRARATLKQRLPSRRAEWQAGEDPTVAERRLVKRYIDVMERGDLSTMAEAMADLMAEDIRVSMPPLPLFYAGRHDFFTGVSAYLDPASPIYAGEWRSVPTRANLQPAVAHYVRPPGHPAFEAQVLDVLWVAEGTIVEITAFDPTLFPRFGLPTVLPEGS